MGLKVSDLSKKYGSRTVVNHISFEMTKPGVYALLGTNGAGKTTTLRMMLNMLSRDSGEVLWEGRPLDTDICNVGYLAEERGLYPKVSADGSAYLFCRSEGCQQERRKGENQILGEAAAGGGISLSPVYAGGSSGRNSRREERNVFLQNNYKKKQSPGLQISCPKEISRNSVYDHSACRPSASDPG